MGISIDTFKKIQEIQVGFYKKHEELVKEHSKLDKELSDIYHYIEFHDLSASDGFKVYKKTQEILRRRRTIKDEVELGYSIKDHLTNFRPQGKIENKINRLETRQYVPRVLKELFEEGV